MVGYLIVMRHTPDTNRRFRQCLAALRLMRRRLPGERLLRHNGQWVINSLIPPFPGRPFQRMRDAASAARRSTPHSVFLAVTDACPADCWHCSMKNRRRGELLSTTEWLDAIGQLLPLGVCIIGLTGGEPLMRNDLPELVRAASQGGAAVQLFTSGIGLTEAKIIALHEAGLWATGVSLDNTDPAVVNCRRGTPLAFDAAIAALQMCHRAGLYTFINAVADRQAVVAGEYRRIYDLARLLKIHEVRLIEPMPCGRLASGDRDRFLGPAEILELRRFHRNTNRRGTGPKVCALNEIEAPEVFGCAAGTRHLFIDPYGEVCPCDFVPLSFGNLRWESLETVYNRMSSAMRHPRRRCFIQAHRDLVHSHADQQFPLPPKMSLHMVSQCTTRLFPGSRLDSPLHGNQIRNGMVCVAAGKRSTPQSISSVQGDKPPTTQGTSP